MTTMSAANDVYQRLERLNRIGAALSNERDINRLLESILIAAMDLTRADGGTLYLMSTRRDALEFVIMRNLSMKVELGGTTGRPIDQAPLPLRRPDGQPNDELVAVHAAVHERTTNVADAYAEAGFDFSGPKRFDRLTGYRTRSILTIAMKDYQDEILGVLQLINATEDGQTVAFSEADQSLAESLASQAAIALTKRRLIEQQERLFESFIGMINAAIDEKSPYTGGHCQRVPELTMMLAEAAARCQQGPLADFSMSEKDRYELKIAGLLHDCGKITTPVHVVDKATKLQTIFDRIELIETRYEVFRRDARIKALEAALALRERRDDEAEARIFDEQARRDTELRQEFNFLRQCNAGGETMLLADQDKVRDIARERQWTNRLDKRLPGLSDDEVENLTIRSGTLTAMERQEINHHIVATIRMLEALPWPRHLTNVPEYAGGHHERMDGRGYPRGLRGKDMSVQARIMAIADIFEALTASDRPYKPGMPLSQSLRIMSNFARNGHIDPDLYEVFVRDEVYLDYARRFLNPVQIDAIAPASLLEACRPAGLSADVAPQGTEK